MNKSVVAMVGVFGLFVLGIVGLFMVLFGGLDNASAGAVLSADSLLQNAASGNIDIVRQHLAIEYSNTLSDEALTELIEENHFNELQSVVWGTTQVENELACLQGTLNTSGDRAVAVSISLVNQQGQWKVDGIQADTQSITERQSELAQADPKNPSSDHSPAQSADDVVTTTPVVNKTPVEPQVEQDVVIEKEYIDKFRKKIPTKSESFDLVKDWTSRFNEGIVDKDFAEFHSQTAPRFKRQVPISRFNQIFQPFIDKEIDLSWVASATPTLKKPPMIDADGVVYLTGQFAGETTLNFEYRFVKDSGQLKPLEVYLQLEGKVMDQVPSIETIKSLVIEKTLAFGGAVKEQDFSDFHRNQLASQFRSKYPIGKFAEIFKAFLNERASLDWIQGVEPEFEVPPSLNIDGVLQAQGSFPSQPGVDFRYAFVQENMAWKLVLININVPPEGEPTDEANADTADSSKSRR